MGLAQFKKGIKIFYYAFATYVPVSRSGLFDQGYYLQSNSLNIPRVLSLFHYLLIGYRKWLQPSPYIVPEYYYSQIEFPETERVEPIYHYLKKGWFEGVNPTPLFDTTRVVKYLNGKNGKLNPLTYYLQNHGEIHFPPSQYFEPEYYTKRYPDIAHSGLDPWSHYLYIGGVKRYCPCKLAEDFFEIAWFDDQKLSFYENDRGVLQNSLSLHLPEHLSQNPVVDPTYITKQIKNSSYSEILRWATQMTENESLMPSHWFDPEYYRRNYLGSERNKNPIKHYCQFGIYNKSYPNFEIESLENKPLISLLVPVYNVKPHYLNRCIRSVLFQSYPHWELCLADDCSTDQHVVELLQYWAQKDDRIKVVCLDKNLGISGATNAAAELATGEYIGFLDNDDELVPESLHEMVKVINNTGADFIYSDEEMIDHHGRKVHTFYKPDLNQELLLCHNYITHFVVTETKLFNDVVGLDPTKNGAQDFDFLLKISERAQKVAHISKSLYKWRATESSTTINHDSKSYADEAGKAAVESALKRRDITGNVRNAHWKFYYTVRRQIVERQKITVIADCRTHLPGTEWSESMLKELSEGLYEIYVIVPVGEHVPELENVTYVVAENSIIDLVNELVQDCSGEQLLFINPALWPQKEDWLTGLLEYSQGGNIGLVCGHILPENKEEYRINVQPDLNNTEPSYFAEFIHLSSVHMNGLHWSQDTMAATLNGCMIKKSLWLQANGLNKEYTSLLYAGLDLSMRLQGDGYRNIYSAYSIMKENGNRYLCDPPIHLDGDMKLFKANWFRQGEKRDPYYNTNVLSDFGVNLDDFYAWYC